MEALIPDPCALIGRPLLLRTIRRWSNTVDVCCPSPEPGTHWRMRPVQPPLCVGRYEGMDRFLGRGRPRAGLSVLAIIMATEPQYVCGAATRHLHRSTEMKSGHDAGCRLRWHCKSGEKRKTPLLGLVCLLTRGVLIRVRCYLILNRARPIQNTYDFGSSFLAWLFTANCRMNLTADSMNVTRSLNVIKCSAGFIRSLMRIFQISSLLRL